MYPRHPRNPRSIGLGRHQRQVQDQSPPGVTSPPTSSVLLLVRITAFTLIAALGITPLAAAQPDLPALEARTAEALRAALAADGAYSAPALALPAVSLTGSRLTVSLARDLLPFAPDSSEFERFSRRLHVAVADVLRAEFEAFEIVTLLDGQPLDQKLAATPPLAVVPFQTQAAPPLSPSGTPVRARSLAARRIAVSPGHG